LGWGQQTKKGPCYNFFTLDKKTYHIELSLKVFICKKYIKERGFMMWMLSAMDGNRQEGKWLVIEHNALRWVKANNASPKRSP